MLYLIIIFSLLFFFLAWRRLDWAVMLLIAALPAYLIRFNILGLPSTLLEVIIWVIFLVWFLKNYRYIIENLKFKIKHSFKIQNSKFKIHRYPFDWELILLLLIALVAAGAAGFSNSSFGIWKAYFFEPSLLFVVLLNVMKNPPYPLASSSTRRSGPLIKGAEVVLWPLAVSALAVSLLAIYQKITGQLIDNPLWAAVGTRRVVSFFGYPNAVGLYLGPLALVFFGWLVFVIASDRRERSNLTDSDINQRLLRPPAQGRRPRNDIIAIISISLTIILSVLSIYFAKSKGALMGVAAGLIMFGLLAGKKIRLAAVIILVLMGAGLAFSQPARHEALKYLSLNNFSGQVRRAQWSETWRMLTDGRVLTGAGLANYKKAVADYHAPGIFIKDYDDPDAQRKLVFNPVYRDAHWQPLEIYLYPHNIFLNFWSELGLAGLLLFIWVIIKYFWLGISNLSLRGSASDRSNLRSGSESVRLLRSPVSSTGSLAMTDRFLNIGLIGAMTAVIVHGLVDVPYFKNDLAVIFWLLVAMMSLINLENKKSNLP